MRGRGTGALGFWYWARAGLKEAGFEPLLIADAVLQAVVIQML
jgi:hypothetical protein